MTKLLIEYRDPKQLKPSAANSRTHTAEQIQQVARAIKTFGFISPVVTDDNGFIIAGHCRVESAIAAGLTSIPTICVSHLTEAQKRAFIIADNRLAELSVWDERKLAGELEELQVLDLDFEITDTGFEIGEIDRLISDLHEEPGADSADLPIEASRVRSVARRGDLWALGNHRLFCGDALDPQSYYVLLSGERAQMVFADAPYNLKISGHVSGRGKVKHPEFLEASGELSTSEFTEFLKKAMRCLAGASQDGSIHFLCMDGPHLRELLNAAQGTYAAVKNVCVWDKGGGGGLGSLYRGQVEFVVVFKRGTAAHINNVQLARFGRNRTTLWK